MKTLAAESGTIAFIPVRGGSKSIPLKNIKNIAGKPLLFWTVDAALNCRRIDAVYVCTDSEEIRKSLEDMKAPRLHVIGRSPETATDEASTESVMLEFANRFHFDRIVLIQATSPLLQSCDLDCAIGQFEEVGFDSMLSLVRQTRFLWKEENGGCVSAINYDYRNRPRRQDFDGFLVENGAFYITSRDSLLKTGCRISGRIGYYEMCAESYFEIDEPVDWTIVDQLLRHKSAASKSDAGDIRMFLSDCDGVLTDGGMYYTDEGDFAKKFNTRDGLGFSKLRAKGIITGIVTQEDSPIPFVRAKKLNLDIIETGCINKLNFIQGLCNKYGISLENVAYIGDDLGDLDTVRSVGIGACVCDAVDEVKSVAKYITKKNGGFGAVREFAEYILSL